LSEINNTPAADDFDAIVAGLAAPAHVFEYSTLAVSENAPEAIVPNRTNRQWALVDEAGRIVALGPSTGGGKSAFIAEAAKHEGWTVAHRMVTSGEWKVPTA
jgi:hypothetical protein